MKRWDEWSLLGRLLPSLSKAQGADVLVGPGDDAAVLKTAGSRWVATTDCLVEGTHFKLSWQDNFSRAGSREFWRSLGWKALAVNISDLAAMGSVVPRWALVTAGLSGRLSQEKINLIHQGLSGAARRFKISVVGGDTVRCPLVFLSVTAIGLLVGREPRLRGSARPGHRLGVTGRLGDACAGLELIGRTPRPRGPWTRHLVRRFLFPTPRLKEGHVLGSVDGVGALVDVSDGLWRSLEILCQASRVGYRVEAEHLPVSAPLKRWADWKRDNACLWAAAGGEDYELLFTYPPQLRAVLKRRLHFVEIGEILPASQGKNLTWRGRPVRALPIFEHFS